MSASLFLSPILPRTRQRPSTRLAAPTVRKIVSETLEACACRKQQDRARVHEDLAALQTAYDEFRKDDGDSASGTNTYREAQIIGARRQCGKNVEPFAEFLRSALIRPRDDDRAMVPGRAAVIKNNAGKREIWFLSKPELPLVEPNWVRYRGKLCRVQFISQKCPCGQTFVGKRAGDTIILDGGDGGNKEGWMLEAVL